MKFFDADKNPPKHHCWVLAWHQCQCCDHMTFSIARLDKDGTWLDKINGDAHQDPPLNALVHKWAEIPRLGALQ